MAQVAVCEGVGGRFEPYYDRMYLRSCPNERVVNMVVNNIARESQAKCRIQRVQPGDKFPCGVEFLLFFRCGPRCVGA